IDLPGSIAGESKKEVHHSSTMRRLTSAQKSKNMRLLPTTPTTVLKESSWDTADPAVADADPGVGNTAAADPTIGDTTEAEIDTVIIVPAGGIRRISIRGV
ncbi:MAG: hypothetical protein J2P17_16370, partial [Mycobacterium sp.]|nr:hypothetical protein [Mycobacterium sp.]